MRKLLTALFIFISGCGGKTINTFFNPSMLKQEIFLAVPFPNELYLDENRHLKVLQYFNVVEPSILRDYLTDVSEDTDWFGLNPTAYFWFSDVINTSSLPSSPAESTSPDSPVIWLEIESGKMYPFMWNFNPHKTKYLPANILAILLYPGFTLQENTLYGVFIRKSIDKRAKPPEFIEKLLNGECPMDENLCEDYFTSLSSYEERFSSKDILTLTVFRTGEPTKRLKILKEKMRTLTPTFYSINFKGEYYSSKFDVEGNYYLYEVTFPVPIFQKGSPPYLDKESGNIEFINEEPILQKWEIGRMLIAVPPFPPPPSGYCVVLYGHGTGGDAWTFFRNNSALNIVKAGCAGAGIDEPLHGIRAKSSIYPWLFFNFLNLKSARDNILQSASELSYYLNILESLSFKDLLNGWTIHFDSNNLYYMGHSQGAIIGIPFLGVENRIKSAVISGGGGFLTYSLIFKTLPFEIRPLIENFIIGEKVNEFHLMLSLFQHFFEPADSINYISKITHSEQLAKNLFISEGLLDQYTPPQTAEAMITAGDIPLLEPIAKDIEGLSLKGISPLTPPVSCNFYVHSECFTIFAVQFEDYGHFAMFDSKEAFRMWREFISTSRNTPTVER